MKTLALFAFCTLATFLVGQEEKNKLEISYSNNGNLANEMDRFYFNPVSEYGPGDDVYNYKETSFKFNLYYGVVTKSKWEFGLNVGFGKRTDKYDISNLPDWSGDKMHNYYSGSLIAKYNMNIDRFEFGSGFEIPFNILSTHTTNYYQHEPEQVAHFRNVVSGGFSFGLNSYSCVSFNLKEWLYLTSKISFGYTHLKVGGELKHELVSQSPETYGNEDYIIDNIYKKNYFSSPDLQIGLGWRF